MAPEPKAAPPKDLPRIIGGYRVLRELGRGRLGPLLLARCGGSGEDVALRVIRPEWSCLPVFVSRLIRNAHAAAHVDHPNLVPILDLGEAQGRVYASSSFIDGISLTDRVKAEGPPVPKDAVAITLQAARGIRAAHAHGLTHGDLSPATILLDNDGRVRVSELGLTKTPASVSTEEVRDKAGPIELVANPGELNLEGVRADLKGLGRTLTFLLTGQSGAIDPTSLIAKGVSVNLVEMVRSLVDSRAGSGFSDFGQAVAALEKYLNARNVGGTAPREEDAAILQESLASFRASPTAKLRDQIVGATAATCGLLVILGMITRLPLIAGSFLGLGLMTALAHFCINGFTRRDELYPRVRALIFESRGADLAIVATGALLFLVLLFVIHLHWAWLCFGILAVVLAVALHHFGDIPVENERKGAIEEARALVRDLRRRGVSEDAILRFVRSTAGADWGPFFQSLFGEEARRAAQEKSDRRILTLLRDPLFAIRSALASWVQDRLHSRRRERDIVFFQAVEERGLVADGVNLLTARRRSHRIAAAMIAVTSEHRDATRAATRGIGDSTIDRPSVAFAVKQAAEAPEEVLVDRETRLIGRDRSWLIDVIFGARTRFLLGSAILAGFLLWVHQNGMISGDQIKDIAVKAIASDDPVQSVRDARIDVHVPDVTKALDAPLGPRFLFKLFNGFHPCGAGLILIFSSFWRGSRVGTFAIPGAAFALVGPALGIPSIGPLSASVSSMAIGAGIASLGFFFGTSPDE